MVPACAPGIGHHGTIERYLTADNLHLGAAGLLAGLAVGLAWRAAGRARWGAMPFLVATYAAAALARRSDWPPRWTGMVAFGLLVSAAAAVGGWHLLAARDLPGWSVVAGAVVSCVAVWSGVPETGPAVLTGAALVGLLAVAGSTGVRMAPPAAVGMAGIVGWAALSGAAGRPWAAVGGALCAGAAPWLALPLRRGSRGLGWSPGPWLLAAHAGLAVVAARWIGVMAHAGWGRVAVLAGAGVVIGSLTRLGA